MSFKIDYNAKSPDELVALLLANFQLSDTLNERIDVLEEDRRSLREALKVCVPADQTLRVLVREWSNDPKVLVLDLDRYGALDVEVLPLIHPRDLKRPEPAPALALAETGDEAGQETPDVTLIDSEAS